MPCYHPLKAIRDSDGVRILPSDARLYTMLLPCGQCIGCRLERSRQWAVRCMHEVSLHEHNCFITLTYNDANLPRDLSLDYGHFQLFMKRLRKHVAPKRVRFYMCGEYGGDFGRPHFHAMLFGTDFDDKVLHAKTGSGSYIYRSKTLESLWTFGFSSIGDATFETAAYVARYVMKKVTGKAAKGHYEIVDCESGEISDRTPEFNRMSLKPGIGGAWFDKFSADVYPHDFVVVNGVTAKPPRYYDRLLKRIDADVYDEIVEQRMLDMGEKWRDNTRARLAVKETVTKARLAKFRRDLT